RARMAGHEWYGWLQLLNCCRHHHAPLPRAVGRGVAQPTRPHGHAERAVVIGGRFEWEARVIVAGARRREWRPGRDPDLVSPGRRRPPLALRGSARVHRETGLHAPASEHPRATLPALR